MRKLSLKFRQAMVVSPTKDDPSSSPTKPKQPLSLLGGITTTTKKPRSNTLSPEAAASLSRQPSASSLFQLKRGRSQTGPTTTGSFYDSDESPYSTSIPGGVLLEARFHSNEDDVFLEDALGELRQVIADRERKHRLISLLLEYRSNNCVKIRFCSAVDELACDVGKAERLSKARSIVRLFVSDTASFPLGPSVPTDMRAKLSGGGGTALIDLLEQLQARVLHELARDDTVMDACRRCT